MSGLQSHSEQLCNQIDSVVEFGLRAVQDDPTVLEYTARDLAVSIARIYIGKSAVLECMHHLAKIMSLRLHQLLCLCRVFLGALLIEHSVSPVASAHDAVVAQR